MTEDEVEAELKSLHSIFLSLNYASTLESVIMFKLGEVVFEDFIRSELENYPKEQHDTFLLISLYKKLAAIHDIELPSLETMHQY